MIDQCLATETQTAMKFHYLVRGIVFEDGKVLLAHQKGADHTFLPGGHIENGEKAETDLIRELEEEIGKKAPSDRVSHEPAIRLQRLTGNVAIEDGIQSRFCSWILSGGAVRFDRDGLTPV